MNLGSPSTSSSAAFVLLSLTMALATSGCDFQRTVDLKPPAHDSKPVLNSEIIPGQPWRVDVSRSVGAFQLGRPSDSTFTVTDATVMVSKEGERQGQLRLDSLNQYSTRQFTPEPGQQYTVRVSAPDLDTVRATDRVPRMPPMRLTAEDIGTVEGYYDRVLRLTIDDPPNTDNYYNVEIQKKGYGYSGISEDSTSIDTLGLTDVRFRTRSRPIINEMQQVLEEANAYQGRDATFKDVVFNGTEHTIRFQVGEGDFFFSDRDAGDGYPRLKYFLYVSTLSEDAYQFDHTQRILARTEGNPFAEPVDVHSNVEGGYGIVAGRHTDTLRVEVSLE